MGGQLPYNLILELRDRYGIRAAVETGTGLGASARWLAAQFKDAWTIEKDEAKHAAVMAEYGCLPNLRILLGDSAKVLPIVLEKMNRSALFWLDAHTGDHMLDDGSIVHNCPRRAEIKAIAADYHKHFVIIDDARLFTGHKPAKASYLPNLWPTLKEFEADMGERYALFMHDDMALFMPEEAREVVELWERGEL